MTFLNGFDIEDLAAAVLQDHGYTHVHVGKPVVRRHQDGHVVEHQPQRDLHGLFDVEAIMAPPHDEPMVWPPCLWTQVKAWGAGAGDAMIDIGEAGAWPVPPTAAIEVWEYKRRTRTFHRTRRVYGEAPARTEQVWAPVKPIVVDDPVALMSRYDTSLDQVTP